MAEKYNEMGSNADGMKTDAKYLSSVSPAWKEVRDDNISKNICVFYLDKNEYRLQACGNGIDLVITQLPQDKIFFIGIRAKVKGEPKFFHVLLVGEQVGIVKRGKAHLQKSACFNAMDGASGEIEVPIGGDATDDYFKAEIADLMNCSSDEVEV